MNETNNTKNAHSDVNSVGFFDLAKGLGMIYIIVGHTHNLIYRPKFEWNGLFSGATVVLGAAVLAMFFMISGYGFFKRKPKKCFSLQNRLLLKPYAITGGLVVLAKLGLALVMRRSFLQNGAVFIPTFLLGAFKSAGGRIFGIPVESIGILWFILSLYEIWIAYNFIVRIKDERIQHAIVIVSVVLGYVLSVLPISLPFMIPQSMICLGFFHVGHLLRTKKVFENGLPSLYMILFGSMASFSLLLGDADVAHGVWRLGLIDVAGTFSLGFLMLYGYVLWMRSLKDNVLTDTIAAIGAASIWIVCIHGFENCVMPWYKAPGLLGGRLMAAFWVVLVCRSVFIYVVYKAIMLTRRRFLRKKKVSLE